MTEIRHITPREQALERENTRLVDKTERQSATIHVQAVALQSLREEIAASERNIEQLTDELAQSRAEIAKLKTSFMDGFEGGKQEARDAAQEEIEALKADAERYQFMRDKCSWTMTSEPLRTTKLSVTINAPLYAESDWDDMDYVFSAAMKESKHA